MDCDKYPIGSRPRAICEGTITGFSPEKLKRMQERLKGEPAKGRILDPGERPTMPLQAFNSSGVFVSVTPARETYGPGSELLKMLAEDGVPSCQACRDTAADMDRLGVEGCRQQLDEFVEEIMPRARDWVAESRPWTVKLLAMSSVVHLDTFGEKLKDAEIRRRLRAKVTEAIDRAEANPAPPPAPVKKKLAFARLKPRPSAARVVLNQPPSFDGPITRHLIYHLYPAAHTDQWRWNLDQLLQRIDVFNGSRILGLAIDKTTVSAQEVRDYLGDRRFEVIEVPNDKRKGELTTFEKMMGRIQTTDPNAIVFYGHGKGTTAPSNGKTISGGTVPEMRRWAEAMYHGCLDDIPRVEAALTDHVFAGGFRQRKSGGKWYYSGTFFWFRANAVFSREWRLKAKQRWAVEFWPATITDFDENVCLFADGVKGLYKPANLSRAIASTVSRPEPVIPAVPKAYTPGISLITPTGDRREAFALCERWIKRQTYTGPLQWIVVDDGKIPTKVTAGQEYHRRQVARSEGHTLPQNLRVALPHVRYDKLLFIEDDDWYAPNYVEQMARWLDDDALVGASFARYYWPRLARYREFPKHEHASLCRTGIRRDLFSRLHRCLNGNQSIDMRLWASTPGRRHDEQVLCISPKGMPGRSLSANEKAGLSGKSHGGDPREGKPDADLSKLREWIGDDVEHFRLLLPKAFDPMRATSERIVVYTVVLGGYDVIRPPRVVNSNVRYVAITDGAAPAPWEVMCPPESTCSRKHETRRLKLLAHELFPDADWTIYFDGQLQLAVDPLALLAECEAWGDGDLYLFRHQDRDCIYAEARAVARIGKDNSANVDPQIERYRAAGFPEQAGLYLGGMLIRRKGACNAFNAAWWGEVSSASHRDQLSLPVALASSGVRFTALPAMWWTHFFLRHPHSSSGAFSRTSRSLAMSRSTKMRTARPR